MNRHQIVNVTRCAALSMITLLSACTKENVKEERLAAGSSLETQAVGSTILNNWSVNWDNYAHGSTYTANNAATDFGNVTGWVDSRGMISNGNLRITLLKNALSGAGGVVANIDISDGTAYEVDYDIRFHSQFDWSRGGKLGFGFSIGDGNTGGDPGWDGNGGSARLMWYQTDAGRVFFQPYVYFKDQSGQYGETFGKSYPSSGSLNKGQTYHVHLYVKSNTGSNTNGHVQYVIDGTVVLDQDIRWTTNDSKRLIKGLTFHTFRGGSQDYWESATDGYIYYDNLKVHRISTN
ncbi:polysaccharide lyase [Chitinophaga filiformis]|uniref:Polysaccharide lyase 14 domain-containing protein n=1 Tax=Chitinophaga filiformis TaxID=104663 RepID=A0A1G7ICT1_CHIFI|nr:hypothetical protein [Chitinophaga filiformis]SDF10433.1 hypothetical protein SAMN04488121_101801 [Chitinophaga filiformis]